MVDKYDTPIINIDYGSCQPFGAILITMGTPGWIDEDFTISAQQHALDKVWEVVDIDGACLEEDGSLNCELFWAPTTAVVSIGHILEALSLGV
jgi:hypothetical protein